MIRASKISAYIFLGMIIVLAILTIAGCSKEGRYQADLHMFAQIPIQHGLYDYEQLVGKNK